MSVEVSDDHVNACEAGGAPAPQWRCGELWRGRLACVVSVEVSNDHVYACEAGRPALVDPPRGQSALECSVNSQMKVLPIAVES